jgi:hypothetical protein
MAVGHAIEDIFEISVWLDTIDLRRLEQRSEDCPTVGAAVRRDLMMPGVWGAR